LAIKNDGFFYSLLICSGLFLFKGNTMKKTKLASMIAVLTIGNAAIAHTQGIENGSNNIATGDTAVAVGQSNIAIGTGAVAVGNGMTKEQVASALNAQRGLINEIAALERSIQNNEAKNKQYLDTVDRIERNKKIIADIQSQLDAAKQDNIGLTKTYQDTKKQYDSQKAIIDDKQQIIGQLDLSQVTPTWETDGGLSALAKEFKAKAEEGVSFSFGEEFYQDYLKKYVNVSTKVDHESKVFDKEKGAFIISTSRGNDSPERTFEFKINNNQRNIVFAEKIAFVEFGEHISADNLAIVKEQNLANYNKFKADFDKNVAAARQKSALAGEMLDDAMAKKLYQNIENSYQVSFKTIRLKELEFALYGMDTSDPKFNDTFKEFELLKAEYNNKELTESDLYNMRDGYNDHTKKHKEQMIVAIQQENAANIKKLQDALNNELTTITDKMTAIDKQLSANQKLIAGFEKDIANRQPTAEELAAYEEAKKVQAELQKQRDQLAGKKDNLDDLQKNMTDGKDAIAIGTNAIASGQAAISLGKDSKAYGNRSVAIGDNAIANNGLDVALGADSVTDKAVATASAKVADHTYQFAGSNPVATVSIGAKGKERTLTHLAAGRLNADSTDAVNGSQLFAANNAIDVVNKKANDNKTAIENLETNIDNVVNKTINIVKGDISKVEAKTDELGKGTALALGGEAAYDKATGKLTLPKYTIQNSLYTNVGSALSALDGQVSQHKLWIVKNQQDIQNHTTQIANNTTSITHISNGLENGTIGLVQQDPNTGVITIGKDKGGAEINMAGKAGNRVVSGIANGKVAKGSNQAINGGQLYDAVDSLNQKIDNSIQNNNTVINTNITKVEAKTDELGKGTANALGGGAEYDKATGKLQAPEYHVQGGVQNNVGDALTALDNQVSSNTTNITQNTTDITNIKNGLENGTIGLVQQDPTTGQITIGKDKGGKEINMAGTDGNRVVSGIANGKVAKDSNEAINGGQLYETEQRIGQQIETTINNNNTVINNKITKVDAKTDELGKGTASALGGGSTYDPVTDKLSSPLYIVQGSDYNNVGGALSALDGQVSKHTTLINQNQQDIQTNTTNITQNTMEITNIKNGLDNGTIGLVQQDSTTGQITVGKNKGGQEVNMAGIDGNRVVSGVANGEIASNSTQAINGGQMFDVIQSLENQSNSRYNNLNQSINHNRKVAAQGIASAMAMQIDMPEANPDGWAGGVGMATYDGQTAMAVGTHYLSKTGKHKFSTSISTGLGAWSKPAAKIGWGFKFN
jgi:hypothetical protein